MANLQSFCGLIFTDACDHAHYSLHNRTYFAGLIFADSCLSAKTMKIRPHEIFPLYGNLEHFDIFTSTHTRPGSCAHEQKAHDLRFSPGKIQGRAGGVDRAWAEFVTTSIILVITS